MADEPREDVRGVLDAIEAMDQPDYHELSAPAAREMRRGLLDAADDPERLAREYTRTVPGPGLELPVRVYEPQGDGPHPVVVYFHGGGFVLGTLDSRDPICRTIAREADAVVVSVAYRLAPEHPFPAAVEDCYAATEWAAANPGQLGGAPGLAVAGDSAGGTLAAVVALMAAEQNGPELSHQALLYPAIGVDEDQASVRENAGIVLDEADLRFFQNCYFESSVHERNPYADPAQAGDLSGVPPATVITAGFDPLRDGAKQYADRLVGDGVGVRDENYPAQVHGFATMQIDAAEAVAVDVGGELRSALRE